MEIGAILILTAVLLVVCAIIIRPFMPSAQKSGVKNKSVPVQSDQQNHELSVLLAEKERLLNSIQEMDFDHETGKIPDELYTGQRNELIHSAAGILKQLAGLGYSEPMNTGYSGKAIPSSPQGSYDDLDEMIARRKLERNNKAVGFCPKCGQALQTSDRFCPKCGTTIAAK
jgi:ribosomal protein S27AE